MPCCECAARWPPAGSVAETLLHETAGRVRVYGDCDATIATKTFATSSFGRSMFGASGRGRRRDVQLFERTFNLLDHVDGHASIAGCRCDVAVTE